MIKRKIKSSHGFPHSSSRDIKRAWKKKVKEWTAFLKDDYDFDYAGILRVLLYKLKRTRECIIKNNVICKKSISEIKHEISEVERLLQRVYNDDYYDKYDRELNKRFGRRLYIKSFENGLVCYKLDTSNARTRAHIRASARAFRLADLDKKRDFKLACKLMADNIWKWWD